MPSCTANARWPAPPEAALRLLAGLGVAVFLAHALGGDLARSLLPLMVRAVEALDAQFRVVDLAVVDMSGIEQLRMRAALARPLFIAGRVFSTNPAGVAEVTTHVGAVLLPWVVMTGLLLAWPVRGLFDALLRVLFTAPVAFPVMLLNAPPTLLAYLWGMLLKAFPSHAPPVVLAWQQVLDGGGRILLGAAGALAVLCAASACRRWMRPARKALPGAT